MNDGAYEELGGTAETTEDQTDAWDVGGAIYEACPSCGAKADERCVVQTEAGLKERHIPCLQRIKGAKNAS